MIESLLLLFLLLLLFATYKQNAQEQIIENNTNFIFEFPCIISL